MSVVTIMKHLLYPGHVSLLSPELHTWAPFYTEKNWGSGRVFTKWQIWNSSPHLRLNHIRTLSVLFLYIQPVARSWREARYSESMPMLFSLSGPHCDSRYCSTESATPLWLSLQLLLLHLPALITSSETPPSCPHWDEFPPSAGIRRLSALASPGLPPTSPF